MLPIGNRAPRRAQRAGRRITLAAVSLAMASGLAWAQPGSATTDILPNRPTVEVGGLEIRDVTLGAPGFGTVTIGRGVFFGLKHDGGVVRAQRVVFERVVRRAGERQVSAPELAMRDVALPVELFRALTEGATPPLDWPALLERTTISEVSIPLAVEDDPAASTRVTFSNIGLKSLQNGRLQEIAIERVATDSAFPGGLGPAFKTGTVSVRGLNVAELVRFATGGSEGEAVSLIESAAIAGLSLGMAEGAVAIDAVELAGLHGRAPVSPPRAPQPPRIVPPGQPDTELVDAARYLREVMKHFRLDRFALSGIQVRSPDFGALSVAGISLAALTGSGLERFEIIGTELSGAAPDMKLGRFVLEKLGYGELLAKTLDTLAAGREPDLSPERIMEAQPRLGALRLIDFALDTPAGPLALAELSLEGDPPEAAVPDRTTLSVKGLSLDLESAAPGARPNNLLALGYRKVQAEGQIQLRSLPGERAALLDETRVAVAEFGSAEVVARLGNIDFSKLVTSPQLSDQILDAAQVESIELRVADAGFAGRLYAHIAQQSGMPEQEARTAAALEVRRQAAELFGGALSPGSADALEAFVRNPGRLVARMLPKPGQPPLRLGELEQLSPPEINERIAITIEAPAN